MTKAAEKRNSKNVFKKDILYVSSEVQPFCSTGGLADVCGSLPKRLKALHPECDIRVILPLYKKLNIDRNKLTYIANTYVNLSWRKEYCGIFSYKMNNVIYYFFVN